MGRLRSVMSGSFREGRVQGLLIGDELGKRSGMSRPVVAVRPCRPDDSNAGVAVCSRHAVSSRIRPVRRRRDQAAHRLGTGRPCVSARTSHAEVPRPLQEQQSPGCCCRARYVRTRTRRESLRRTAAAPNPSQTVGGRARRQDGPPKRSAPCVGPFPPFVQERQAVHRLMDEARVNLQVGRGETARSTVNCR
jgi:hypothetical protein